jgi:large subunit ribosomal protein L25
MAHIVLNAENREVTGKEVRRLRQDGIIPVVVYGGTLTSALSLQVSQRELDKVLRQAGASQVIDLTVEGKRYPVLTREVQRHVTRHTITHVDFLAVRLDQLIEAQIPVHIVGEAAPVERREAVLSTPLNALTIRALPEELPAQIEVDISGLTEVGQSITVADLSLPAGVTVVTDAEATLAALAAPTISAEAEAEAEAEAGPPEPEPEPEPGAAGRGGAGAGPVRDAEARCILCLHETARDAALPAWVPLCEP